jgi:dienelactone hydrolase
MRRIVWIVLLAAAPGLWAQAPRTVRLSTPDDVGIIATYYPTEKDHAPAVVLLHGYGLARDEWSTFAPLLQEMGIASLAIDMRGHGESTRRLTANGPVLVDFKSFTVQDFQKMLLDVNGAVDWLTEQPGVDNQRVGIVGSDFGANIALRYALFNGDLKTIVLFSPLLDYRGVRADDVMKRLGPVPLRIFVSREDPYSFEPCKQLMAIRKEAGHTRDDKELTVCTGAQRGTAMLKGVQGLQAIVLGWLQNTLIGPEPEPTTPLTPPVPPPPTPAPPVPAK